MKSADSDRQDPMATTFRDEPDATHNELQLAREKIQIERERLALERDRLAAERERTSADAMWRERAEKGVRVSVSTLVFVGIIALLTGGLCGILGTTIRQDRRQSARRQEFVQALSGQTNTAANGQMPLLLQSLRGQGGEGGGILLILD
jgi:hypothetical protein